MNGRKNLGSPCRAFLVCCLIAAFAAANAEIIGSPEEGWSIDLPEGYILAEKSGSDRYRFTHTIFSSDLLIARYDAAQFSSAEEALIHVQKQFTDTQDRAAFFWRNREAALGKIESSQLSGWSLALELPEKRGWLAFASVSPPDKFEYSEILILSTLDAVCTDEGSWFASGPITTFAWPQEGPLAGQFKTAEYTVEAPFDATDIPASQAVVDREFSLLTAYLDSPLVYDAWKRYYRMIWKDSWERMEKAAFVAAAVLPDNAYEKAAVLLEWTQSFRYERNLEQSDFASLPAAFIENRGDCDSRALLTALLLNQMGIDAVVMISPEFSHALVGVDCEGEGARFESGGKKYLVGDTTAKVKMGLIAREMADPTKWFAVHFPAFPQATPSQ